MIISAKEFDVYKYVLMRSWRSQQLAINDILKLGFADAFGITCDSFAKTVRKLTCVDGRTLCSKIAIPGAGILMDDEGRLKTATLLMKADVRISGVYPHKGCGAEAEARRLLELQGTNKAEIDAEITRRYKHMASLLHVKVEHPAEMRHMHFHNERSLIFSGVDHFDPFGLSGFTPFLINARFMPSLEDALATVPFCINIALGSHGFGLDKFEQSVARIGDRGRFLIILIGSPFKKEYGCSTLHAQLYSHIKEFEHLVKVVSYDVPEEMLG
jgi:hypothetical protein